VATEDPDVRQRAHEREERGADRRSP